ncbi:MAG: flavin reductase family protein, partial [Bacteroidales bacterium]|nr:flavin reductase family protein [Candidatus Sodaliphilus aphodohippi]
HGPNDMFISDVMNVIDDHSIINHETGALALKEADLITYCHGHYYTLGEELGNFGWTVRKPVRKRK